MAGPKRQLAALLAARAVEPLGYTILFPFVNNFMEDLLPNVPKANIGKYSGAFESIFSLTSILFMYQWGRLSDSMGRKPIILGGLAGLSMTMFLLGTSQNIWWAWSARVLGGMLCGTGSVMRAALAEIATKETEGWMYPLWSICFDIACIIGPALGAVLHSPAKQYPGSWIGKIAFLKRFPYFLPLGLVGTLALGSALIILVFFEETLKPARTPAATEPNDQTPLLTKQDEVEAPWTLWRLVALKPVQRVLVNTFGLAFIAMSYDAGFVLFAYSAPSLGGIGLRAQLIALCLSIKGGLSMCLALTVFPIAKRRLSVRALYRILTPCWVAAYFLPPMMNLVARQQPDSSAGDLHRLWILMGPNILCFVLGDLCFPLNMMTVNAAAPSRSSLGSLNAISSIVFALARGSGPAAFGLLYTWSANTGLPIVWIVFGIVAALTALQCSRLPSHSNSIDIVEADGGTDETPGV